jgi:anti-sigma factor RsiW
LSETYEGPDREFVCEDSVQILQEYLDGTLAKTESLALFLHVRECSDCSQRLESWRTLYRTLNEMPTCEVPSDFDERVLAAVPYAAYRAMEPLRRDRVAVYLEEEFLPAALRAPVTRVAGLTVAAGAGLGLVTGAGPASIEAVALLGILPEVLVRLQELGRRLALTSRRSET